MGLALANGRLADVRPVGTCVVWSWRPELPLCPGDWRLLLPDSWNETIHGGRPGPAKPGRATADQQPSNRQEMHLMPQPTAD